ncbi:OLC1v1028375C1 [Oldenlandia corymbosa var. corymbosa]|uniref:OLC1v1028375C1 n=1 Tax=Oldenlandia corymbosa var. corymbosa TaxID=529605 RepID=A0AAV1CDJ3_OLDCO|nr:OLC1v1028375C1 [Oldenlandia corymbosa var. corymbosa]
MAGQIVSVDNQQLSDGAMAMSAIVDRWDVQYARFLRFPPSSSDCTQLHPLLVRRKFSRGVWISTSASDTSKSSGPATAGDASLKLIADRSDDAILNLSVRCKVIEEHRISKLNFTWPCVSCVSGVPPRGARVVFVSYKDTFGQVQKFTLRFSDTFDAERFIGVVKEIMDARNGVQGAKSNSELSSQSEFVPSIEVPSRAEEDCRNTTSANTSTYQGPESLSYEVDTVFAREDLQEGKAAEILSDIINSSFAQDAFLDFPPSFTSFLQNICPASEKVQSSAPVEVDLKSQVVRYLEDSSFQDLLIKVEKIIGEIGDT